MYYAMSQSGAEGWLMPLIQYHFTLVQNIKRDPFEQAVGKDAKTTMAIGGALATPSTAYLYDWNILPIGQQLWKQHLMSFKTFPPLQPPEAYNLEEIEKQVKQGGHPSD
jgi:arylsulfatase